LLADRIQDWYEQSPEPAEEEEGLQEPEPEEEEEEEGLQGVFKRLRRNGHQLEKGLQMAQRGPSLTRASLFMRTKKKFGIHTLQ
jgi:hypothetical protein